VVILTYIIRILMLIGLTVSIPLLYAMGKDVMTWGKDEN
jgi:hypothetical protein